MKEYWIYQNVQCVIVKNQNLLKSKKLKDYEVNWQELSTYFKWFIHSKSFVLKVKNEWNSR